MSDPVPTQNVPTGVKTNPAAESPASGTGGVVREPIARRYLATLLLIPVLLYAAVFPLFRLPAFERIAGDKFGALLDFGFQAAGENADVVIFGDSSALYGLRPVLMSKELNQKVINLPNTGSSLMIVNDMALRQYLSRNAPPKLIVLYMAPWNFNYTHSKRTPFVFEGEEMLIRHGNAAELLSYVRRHPQEASEFPFQFYAVGPKNSLIADLKHDNRVAAVRATMGAMDYPKNLPHLTDDCVIPQEIVEQSGYESVRELAARYTTPQTRVLVYAAPVPSCKNIATVLQYPYASIPAAPPKQLPANLYGDDPDPQYIHLFAGASGIATSNLVEAVRPLLGEAQPPRGLQSSLAMPLDQQRGR